jgi:hypothetical protein
MREIVVTRLVVSAAGSAQMQVSVPSSPTPDGPNAASLRGTPSSWARTSADRIARQSVGRATDFAVLVGDGDADGDGAPDVLGDEDADGVPPPPEPVSDPTGLHPVRTASRTIAAAAVVVRAFMATPYSPAG